MKKKIFIKILALSLLITSLSQIEKSMAAEFEGRVPTRGLSLSPDLTSSSVCQQPSDPRAQSESSNLPIRFAPVPYSWSPISSSGPSTESSRPSAHPLTRPLTPTIEANCHHPVPLPHLKTTVTASNSTQTLEYSISGDDNLSNLLRTSIRD